MRRLDMGNEVQPEKEVAGILKPKNRGMKLNYVALTLKHEVPVACLDKNEIEIEAAKWKTTVILYVIGAEPTIKYLRLILINNVM